MILGAFLLSPPGLSAAVPTLEHLFPVAFAAGSTGTVTAVGKFDPWPPQVWMDTAGCTFTPETNRGKFLVEVAADVPVGPHLIHLYNEQGASGLRFLVVTREPQTMEAEPNDDFAKPQVIPSLPASINGRLVKSGDVDSFGVTLEAGQTLVAAVEAFTLASPVDAVLRVVDARGVQVAFNHDSRGALDPLLAWTAPAPGTYVVQLFGFAYPPESDVRFKGNDRCVYRLRLSCAPFVQWTVPLGVQRGVRTPLQLRGWNLTRHEVEFDGRALPEGVSRVPWENPAFENVLSLPVGEGPEVLEHEPNDTLSETNRLDWPCAVTGCIDRPGDVDRYPIHASKGDKLMLEVTSSALGGPLDAWLSVENSAGKEVARNDDSGGSADPRQEWVAGADGNFVVTVGSVLQRGGPDYLYRLSVRRVNPALKATVPDSAFTVEKGKTTEIKVTLKRLNDYKLPLTVAVRGLPEGVTAESVIAGEKAISATLQLIASTNAAPHRGPIEIVATETGSGKEHPVVVELTSSTVDNGVPGGFYRLVIESTPHLWLTVPPAPEAKRR